MKQLLQKILKIIAKLILLKYKPEVIGITGSVGKTGAKEAIYAVLAPKFKVRQNIKNYNNEFGLPLTIIGAESPLDSILGWLEVFILAIKLILKNDRDFPKVLILEMAADKPGDLAYLTEMVKCDIAVITSIGESHIENFKTLENIKREKAILITKLEKDHRAVLNVDDEKIRSLIRETKAKVFTYAVDNPAELAAKEIRVKYPSVEAGNRAGISFKLVNSGSFAPVFLPDIISSAGVYAALAGAAVGLIKGLNLVEISQILQKYKAPNGRMKILSGIKNTFIIDDSYNASPMSSVVALAALGNAPADNGRYKYAILGDMLELGGFSEQGHRQVGRMVVENKIDKLIVVGERSRDIARGAYDAGMKTDDVVHFASPEEAGKYIEERLKTGEVVLVKGSQGARMEKVVQAIMAEPLRAKELLVRQGREWKNK